MLALCRGEGDCAPHSLCLIPSALTHYDSVMESSRRSVITAFGIRGHIPTSARTSALHYPETGLWEMKKCAGHSDV
jgi:hypothetical protein